MNLLRTVSDIWPGSTSSTGRPVRPVTHWEAHWAGLLDEHVFRLVSILDAVAILASEFHPQVEGMVAAEGVLKELELAQGSRRPLDSVHKPAERQLQMGHKFQPQ